MAQLDIWISVYITDGVVASIQAFRTKEEALNDFDKAAYDLVGDNIEDFEYYDRNEDGGDCSFVENTDISRHPVEMIVQRTPII